MASCLVTASRPEFCFPLSRLLGSVVDCASAGQNKRVHALACAQNVCALKKEPDKQHKDSVKGNEFHWSKYMKSMNIIPPE